MEIIRLHPIFFSLNFSNVNLSKWTIENESYSRMVLFPISFLLNHALESNPWEFYFQTCSYPYKKKKRKKGKLFTTNKPVE